MRSASITNCQLGTLDLTPDDGVAAGYETDMVVSLYLPAWSDIIVLPAVREPGTWAMLCAGPGLLGAAAHRRRVAG